MRAKKTHSCLPASPGMDGIAMRTPKATGSAEAITCGSGLRSTTNCLLANVVVFLVTVYLVPRRKCVTLFPFTE